MQKSFISALAADFEEFGAGAIRVCRIESPTKYLAIVASLMPKEMIVGDSALADFSDEDQTAFLLQIRQLRASTIDAVVTELPPPTLIGSSDEDPDDKV